jgi:hypothetical protein
VAPLRSSPRGINFGVVLGVGGAFAITAFYDDKPALAALVAAITIVSSLIVYLKVDRQRRSGRRG